MTPDGLLDIAIVAATALVWGMLLQFMRQPAIVGYIVAGVFLGPSGLSLITDRDQVAVLAELGVLLLLFIIGMELSLRGFRRVLRIALLGMAMQVALSLGAMLVLREAFGWSGPLAVLLGFSVALSSTAVAMKILEDIGELRSETGRTAIGVLIAQDLAIVPMLLIVDGMAKGGGIELAAFGKVAIAVGLLMAMTAYLTRRERISLPLAKHIGDNVELMALTALSYCFVAALVSAFFGLSPAYGAFLAGLWIGNSTSRPAALAATMPIQSVLLMVFFLSIGLLLDLQYIWDHLGQVLVLLAIVTVLKTAMNVAILIILGEPWPRAWLSGVVIGQIGEFSFVLVAAGVAAGLIGPEGQKLVISLIALSLMVSPLWLVTARRLHGLAWSGITSLRGLASSLYEREATALVVASGRAIQSVGRGARFTLKLGGHGWRGMGRASGKPTDPKDGEPGARDRDAAFPTGDETHDGDAAGRDQ